MKMQPYECTYCTHQMDCPFYTMNISSYQYPYSYYEAVFNPDSTSNPGDANFAGTWDSTLGTLTMTQSGNVVNGVYTFYGGTLQGIVSGNTMTGTWREYKYPGNLKMGRFRFVMKGPDLFNGTRGDGDKYVGAPWDGHKISS